MDLYAYCQISELSEIAKLNGIEVPRLRGYRLMAAEERLSEEDIQEMIFDHKMHLCDWACCSIPPFTPTSNVHEFSPRTSRIRKKYLLQRTVTETRHDGTEFLYREVHGFRWELLHGKNRNRLKLALKQGERKVRRQLETFNKYVGRDDVLYVHARIGGENWVYYGGEDLEKQPWFIEKVDDYFDSTYCDIYARIEEVR